MNKEKMKKAYRLVEEVLKESAKARNDNMYLVYMVWLKQQNKTGRRYTRLQARGSLEEAKSVLLTGEDSFLLQPETITRARRQIQNTEGRFLPDADVMKSRGKKAEEYREDASQGRLFE